MRGNNIQKFDCGISAGETAKVDKQEYQLTRVDVANNEGKEPGMKDSYSCLATAIYKLAEQNDIGVGERVDIINRYCRRCGKSFYRVSAERMR